MNDYVFGFRHNEKPVDVLDNEYITLKFYKSLAYSFTNRTKQSIHLYDCTHTSFLSESRDTTSIEKGWGRLVCIKPNNQDNSLVVTGSSEGGYPKS